MTGFRENWNLNIYEIIDFFGSQKANIEPS